MFQFPWLVFIAKAVPKVLVIKCCGRDLGSLLVCLFLQDFVMVMLRMLTIELCRLIVESLVVF